MAVPLTKKDWKAYATQLESQCESLQAELRQMKEEASRLIQHAPSAIYEVDLTVPCFTRVNDAMCAMFGYTREELLGMSPFELLDEESQKTFQERLQNALSGQPLNPTVEYQARSKDGRIISILLNTSIQQKDSKPHLATVIAHDVTERRQAEEVLQRTYAALQEQAEELEIQTEELQSQAEELKAAYDELHQSEANYRRIVETAYEGIWVTDTQNITTLVNQRMAQMLGYEIEEMTGESIFNFADPNDLDYLRAQRKERKEGWKGQYEARLIRKDGNPIWVLACGTPVYENNHLVAILVMMTDISERKQMEQQLREANEQLEQRVKARTQELRVANEELLNSNQELEQAEEELRVQNDELEKALEIEKSLRMQIIQTEKFSALARLLGSVAHEINNPLQTVQNCLYLLQAEIPAGLPRETLAMAISESRRISALVQQLRETYRPSDLQSKDFDLIELLEKISTLLAPQLRQSNVEWQMHTEQDCVILHGIPDQVQQVCLNICLNAIDVMSLKGGRLAVDVALPEEKEVCISFHDTGPGIPPKNLEHIFEPFFTTKSKGVGLGLSICYEIVKAHHGEITVESKPGSGATFKVWLPVNN